MKKNKILSLAFLFSVIALTNTNIGCAAKLSDFKSNDFLANENIKQCHAELLPKLVGQKQNYKPSLRETLLAGIINNFISNEKQFKPIQLGTNIIMLCYYVISISMIENKKSELSEFISLENKYIPTFLSEYLNVENDITNYKLPEDQTTRNIQNKIKIIQECENDDIDLLLINLYLKILILNPDNSTPKEEIIKEKL